MTVNQYFFKQNIYYLKVFKLLFYLIVLYFLKLDKIKCGNSNGKIKINGNG